MNRSLKLLILNAATGIALVASAALVLSPALAGV
jgi:hypothetical protein